MQRFDIPRTGNWATAILQAISEAEDGDEIMVHSHTQERFAITKLKSSDKDITVVHAGQRWRRILIDPNSENTARRMFDSITDNQRGGSVEN